MGTAPDMKRPSQRPDPTLAVGLGVSIEALAIRTSTVAADAGAVRSDSFEKAEGDSQDQRGNESVPPLILLPHIQGEPIRIDSTVPRHPRCTGDVWPPKQRDSGMGTSPAGWLPLALAWAEFVSRDRSLQTAAVTSDLCRNEASAARSLMGHYSETEMITAAIDVAERSIRHKVCQISGDQTDASLQPVVVIPNTLTMARQQALIEACRQSGIEAKLVWRPVATALAWCEQFEQDVINRQKHHDSSLEARTGGTTGLLLCLHLGLSEFELTLIELVTRESGQRCYLVPARRRPRPDCDVMPSFGLELLAAAHQAALTSGEFTTAQHWDEFWSRGQVREVLRQLSGRRNESSLSVVDLLTRVSSNATHPGTSRSPDGASRGQRLNAFFDWLDTGVGDVVRPRLESSEALDLMGIVVTGELSQSMYDESRTLWSCCLERLGIDQQSVQLLVDDPLAEGRLDSSLPARGAAMVAQRLNAGETAWLDTLPQLRTATYQGGKAAWLDLLQSEDTFVEGGRVWRRPEPVRGLSVQAGRQSLEVPVWHEEFPTVRKVIADFDASLEADVLVELDVRIEPAQGNARIEVRPIIADSVTVGTQVRPDSSMRTLWLEWSRMTDEGVSPDEWLSNLPTSYPPPMRRSASRAKWHTARKAMQVFVQSGSMKQLFGVIQLLQQRDIPDASVSSDSNIEARATAVSSDGEAPNGDAELLVEYAEHLIDYLGAAAVARPSGDVLRGLAYASTGHPRFQQWLDDRIRAVGLGLSQQELAACGWCLRKPEAIAALAEVFVTRLEQNSTGHNNWLKAMAEILRYREDASRNIDTLVCERLVACFCRVFEGQLAQRNIQHLFRYSALCIVYLLRRRAYDDAFLSPSAELTQRVKGLFSEAIEMIRSGRARTIGGSINLDRALQTMIDYIDRKGPALLSASGFQELAD